MSAAGQLSIVIPVYNGDRFISEAVASARRQNPAAEEIIVVDDGSTDDTAQVVRSLPGVTYAWQENRGPAAARNHGFRLSSGSLLCFLDADDRLADNKTRIQARMLADNPALDIVIGHLQRVVIRSWAGSEPQYAPVGDPMFLLHLGSSVIRRDVFDRIGLFEESLGMGEDVDWYLRAKESGIRMRFHAEVVQYRLLHDRNMTLQRDQANQFLIRAFKRSLDRRRSDAKTQWTTWDWSEETQDLPRGAKSFQAGGNSWT
jgi:glycosyltransferase involved in cell wall biosynthesis